MNLIQLLGDHGIVQALFSYPTTMSSDEAEQAITECIEEAYQEEQEFEETDEIQEFDILDVTENKLELRYNIRRMYTDEVYTNRL